ncbi:hypothetical protein BDW02DRAFT_507669 [Decorospora gaudefroyi]|uniref:Uncharacterized protein n=1 Tax=Decorospora gaudefroyi TaxID=184978 RepID=A0A6A5JZH5_9PLEO|nr:hypothetical protein BDW02DRAFT_507669 [Decorospora gaudefroyi]
MPFTFDLPRDTSPRLRILQLCQTGIAALTVIATLITIVVPHKYKLLTLSLLYTPILTSITTILFVVKEQKRAVAGTLTKQKYAKYQMLKMTSAFGMSVVGFIAYLATAPVVEDKSHAGEQGMWLNGIKVNKWQGLMLWLNFFNWVFLWASLFYSCCMTGSKQGPIALADDEAQIGFQDETAGDEAAPRNLQAEDANWRA